MVSEIIVGGMLVPAILGIHRGRTGSFRANWELDTCVTAISALAIVTLLLAGHELFGAPERFAGHEEREEWDALKVLVKYTAINAGLYSCGYIMGSASRD